MQHLKFTTRCNHGRGGGIENIQFLFTSPIGYFKSTTGDILANWGLVICSLTLRYQTHLSRVPNWVYYPQLVI